MPITIISAVAQVLHGKGQETTISFGMALHAKVVTQHLRYHFKKTMGSYMYIITSDM